MNLLIKMLTIAFVLAHSNTAFSSSSSNCSEWSQVNWRSLVIELHPARTKENSSLEGYVDVEFSISTIGKAIDINILESSPEGAFENGLLDVMKKWRFRPTVENGAALKLTCLRFRQNFKPV